MTKSNKAEEFDNSFYQLTKDVTRRIEQNKDGTDQQQQVEALMKAENDFKNSIIKYKRQSTKIYEKFWAHIRITNKNILSARPYFRAKDKYFSTHITPAFKDRDIDKLKKFDINYQLVKFIKEKWEGPFSPESEEAYQRVVRTRNILLENNMPLVINRANLFFRSTQKSHLSLMDMIGLCSLGLAAGVDKFSGPYSTVFRSVCIGRMVGNLIASYSSTVLYLYPTDRKILYKANTIKSRQGIEEIEELVEAVNAAFAEAKAQGQAVPKEIVTPWTLQYLLNAAHPLSEHIDNGDESFSLFDFTEDDSQDVAQQYERQESTAYMLSLAGKLPIVNRKILRLKGVRI